MKLELGSPGILIWDIIDYWSYYFCSSSASFSCYCYSASYCLSSSSLLIFAKAIVFVIALFFSYSVGYLTSGTKRLVSLFAIYSNNDGSNVIPGVSLGDWEIDYYYTGLAMNYALSCSTVGSIVSWKFLNNSPRLPVRGCSFFNYFSFSCCFAYFMVLYIIDCAFTTGA